MHAVITTLLTGRPAAAGTCCALRSHTRTDCDPSNYERVHKKKRCPVPGCRDKLTTLTSCEW